MLAKHVDLIVKVVVRSTVALAFVVTKRVLMTKMLTRIAATTKMMKNLFLRITKTIMSDDLTSSIGEDDDDDAND